MTTWVVPFTAAAGPTVYALPSFVADNALVTSVIELTAGTDITQYFGGRVVKQGATVWLVQPVNTAAVGVGDRCLVCIQST